jgi:hypothetical protein
MRYARNSLFASLFLTVSWLGACEDSQPSSPELPSVRAAKGGGKPLKVNATDPNVGEQGTVDLSVRVLGSGFDDGSPGSPVVTWLLDGDPTGVTTTFVDFGSNPDKELLTRITIDDEARLGLWDVEVQTLRGKKGIGMERFEVKTKTLPNHPIPIIVDFRDGSVDGVRSDDGTTYEDGLQGVTAQLLNDLLNALDTRGSARTVVIDLTHDVSISLPDRMPPSLVLNQQAWLVTQDPDLDNLFDGRQAFFVVWLDSEDKLWSLNYGKLCSPNDAWEPADMVDISVTARDAGGNPTAWTLEVASDAIAGNAYLCRARDGRGKAGRGNETVGRFNAPTRMEITAIGSP